MYIESVYWVTLLWNCFWCSKHIKIRNNNIYRITLESQLCVSRKKIPRWVPCHVCHTSTQFLTYNTPLLWSWFLCSWWNLAYKFFFLGGTLFSDECRPSTLRSTTLACFMKGPSINWILTDSWSVLFLVCLYIIIALGNFHFVPYSFAYFHNGCLSLFFFFFFFWATKLRKARMSIFSIKFWIW
jgi:hypothetical protein